MARVSDEDLQKLVQEEDAANYGDESFEPVDIDKVAKETYGNELEDDEEVNIAEEVEKDEKAENETIEDDPQTLEDFEKLQDQ